MATRTIAIIGGGFTGTALALHLLRVTGPATAILLIERRPEVGVGVAYSTANPSHLLNVPAARMSAFDAQPDDFTDWLRAQTDAPAGPFVPRTLFGAYVRDLLDGGARSAGGRLRRVNGDVAGLSEGAVVTIALQDGRRFDADIAVLATGNYAPAPVLRGAAAESPAYRGNPWAAAAKAGLDPDAAVVLIGTGLTMVDTVLTLLDQGHRGSIHALSRHGLTPHRHVPAATVPLPPAPGYPARLSALMRCLRMDAAACIAAGGAWQDAVDRFRPRIRPAWAAFSLAERARFVRHVRPWWDIHRHRIAGPVADRVDAARARGQLQIVAGRIRGAAASGNGLDLRCDAGGPQVIHAARVINCTGPAADLTHIADGLIQGLLRDGLARPGPLGIGLDVTGSCAVIGAGGPSRRLFALGPITRGVFWEVTAVPDIRQQCDTLATHFARLLASGLVSLPHEAAP